MSANTCGSTAPQPAVPLTIKDLNTENPRWCVGCGDFGIVMGVKRFMVDKHLGIADTVNVSGIGCSGRAPNYINTYGVHSIHGRPITVALGLALARPELNIFIHSGDGDALSIGGDHLIHGINKNFNCVFIMYDNELYALTKSQTSPTTRKGHKTNTQPAGTYLEPINALRLVLGIGASFVASTADWMPDHFVSCLEAGFAHKGFSFIHVSQRCRTLIQTISITRKPTGFLFLKHPKGIAPDKRTADRTEQIEHDPSDLNAAFKLTNTDRTYFGLLYHNPDKPRYDTILHEQVKSAPPASRKEILDRFRI